MSDKNPSPTQKPLFKSVALVVLAALGATPPDAITVTVRRPEPAAAHFAD